MRLFREQGWEQTTIEQIAEAAEVSPSTFFRYFPTKEEVVLQDDYDDLMVEAFRAQPPELTPLQAMRKALREVLGSLTPREREEEDERLRLSREVPELRRLAPDRAFPSSNKQQDKESRHQKAQNAQKSFRTASRSDRIKASPSILDLFYASGAFLWLKSSDDP